APINRRRHRPTRLHRTGTIPVFIYRFNFLTQRVLSGRRWPYSDLLEASPSASSQISCVRQLIKWNRAPARPSRRSDSRKAMQKTAKGDSAGAYLDQYPDPAIRTDQRVAPI